MTLVEAVAQVDIMLRLEHPNVVGCLQPLPGLDPGTPDLPTLCMEYCEGERHTCTIKGRLKKRMKSSVNVSSWV
jgi:hypothetical protein